MKAYFIHVGQVYQAKVSGRLAPVRVEWKKEVFDHKGRSRTWYYCRNLLTGKQIICKSSQRLRDKPLPPAWAALATATTAAPVRVDDLQTIHLTRGNP